jgi:DNA-binding transcriptional MocR family regulator
LIDNNLVEGLLVMHEQDFTTNADSTEKQFQETISEKIYTMSVRQGVKLGAIAKKFNISISQVQKHIESYIDRELIPKVKLGTERCRAMQLYELEQMGIFLGACIQNQMKRAADDPDNIKIDGRIMELYHKNILQRAKLLGTEIVQSAPLNPSDNDFPVTINESDMQTLAELSDDELQKRYLETLAQG